MNNQVVRVIAGAVLGSLATLVILQRRRRRRERPEVGKRLIFLDLDGVVNRTKRADQIILAPDLVAKLRLIVERGGAGGVQIVLSTFWKPFDCYIAYALSRQGIDGSIVVRSTPGRSKSTVIQFSSASHLLHTEAFDDLEVFETRAAEIRLFLSRHPQVEHFVILDDRLDAADGDDLLPHFVRTDPGVGLTDDHVEKALALLR